jgi:hypothetical protein
MPRDPKRKIDTPKDSLQAGKKPVVVGPKAPKAAIVIDEAESKSKQKFLTKRKVVIALGILVALLVVAATAWALLSRPEAPTKQRAVSKTLRTPPRPKTAPSPLTGVEVPPELADNPVVSVVIENLYPSARPQSGLSSAGIVYETLAEGGITRYQAFFGDTMPLDVGPVRSLRTFFVRWGLEYDAPVVHAGGNIDALDLIRPLGMKDLDQFANGGYFRRIPTRYAPHNLYTTGAQLEKLMQARGYYSEPTFAPWLRKGDKKVAAPTASSITIDPSYPDYRVTYSYDPASNSYTRSIRGVADIDASGNVQIKPKNVVVLKAATTYGTTRANTQAVYTQTVGSGSGVIFMDGQATEITWRKPSDKARTQFYDAAGKEVALNRGQTWVTVIPLEKSVSYK